MNKLKILLTAIMFTLIISCGEKNLHTFETDLIKVEFKLHAGTALYKIWYKGQLIEDDFGLIIDPEHTMADKNIVWDVREGRVISAIKITESGMKKYNRIDHVEALTELYSSASDRLRDRVTYPIGHVPMPGGK